MSEWSRHPRLEDKLKRIVREERLSLGGPTGPRVLREPPLPKCINCWSPKVQQYAIQPVRSHHQRSRTMQCLACNFFWSTQGDVFVNPVSVVEAILLREPVRLGMSHPTWQRLQREAGWGDVSDVNYLGKPRRVIWLERMTPVVVDGGVPTGFVRVYLTYCEQVKIAVF